MSSGSVAQHLQLAATIGVAGFSLFLVSLLAALRRTRVTLPTRRLQVGLTLLSSLLVVALFLVGFRGYVDAAVAPGEALAVRATAERWRWSFTYADGKTVTDRLRLPAGRPVQVTVRSRDLVHRFVAPGLHLSAEARPGHDGSVWFLGEEAGASSLLCGEACSGHPEMHSTIELMAPKAFEEWLSGGVGLPPAKLGEELYVKNACKGCHSTDGTPGVGPTFKGLFGKEETLADGATVEVNAAYLRESIVNPPAKLVRGFAPVMPPFPQLEDKQLQALIAFIQSVKP